MQGIFTSICNVNDGFAAGTKSGVYFSSSAGFNWKRISPFYYEVTELFNVDSVLFAHCIVGPTEKLLRSADRGQHWDTVLNALQNGNKGFSVVGKTILYKTYSPLFSTDYGSSWQSYSNPYINIYYNGYGVCNNGIMGFHAFLGRGILSSYAYYYSADAIHFHRMFDTTSRDETIPFFTLIDSSMYIIDSRDIIRADTATGKPEYIGTTPGLELRIGLDSNYLINFLYKIGNTYFLGYKNTFGGLDNDMVVYSSKDIVNWVPHAIQSSTNTNLQATFLPDINLLTIAADPVNLRVDSSGISKIASNGIAAYNLRMRQIDKKLIQVIDPVLGDINIRDGSAADTTLSGEEALTVERYKKYQQTYHPASGSFGVVVGKTNQHIFYNDNTSSLFISADTGQSWQDITYNTYFSFNSIRGVIEYKKSYLVITQSPYDQNALYLDPVKKLWHYASGAFQNPTISELDTTYDGAAIAFAYSGSQGIIYLDSSSHLWIQKAMSGLPKSYYRFLIQYDKLFAFDVLNGGAYESDDLGDSFQRDISFPDGVKAYTFGPVGGQLMNNYGRLDSVFYVSTSAGIWYRSLNPPKAKDKHTQALNKDTVSSEIEVYPNPVTDKINVSFYDTLSCNIIFRLTDVTGQVCATFRSSTISGQNKFSFDRAGLRDGVYIFQLVTGNSIKTVKMVLE
jgi:hypothetical protein